MVEHRDGMIERAAAFDERITMSSERNGEEFFG